MIAFAPARMRRLAALCAASLMAGVACGQRASSTSHPALPAGAATAVPARSPAAVATASPAASSAEVPAQILDLANWKVTVPVNSAGAFTGTPLEIQQPALARYVSAPYFAVRGDGVQFRAPVNGVTTSGSRYPRSELREMAENGTKLASWSTTTGTHTMTIDEAITAVPQAKPHVVAGQIHDAKDDVLTIRLEQPRLFVDHNGKDGGTLTTSYVLGTRFTVKIEVAGGQIEVYYNGSATPADTLAVDRDGNYFKAGAYTQSNCTRERTCSADNYGEVVIYHLDVTHR